MIATTAISTAVQFDSEASVASAGPRLPPELCDYMLDFLAPPYEGETIGGRWTFMQMFALAACTQVCRGWLPRARTHLYSIIHLHKPQNALGLIATLSREPVCAARVREIKISVGRPDHAYFPLLRLLSLSSRLEHLSLRGLDLDHNYPSSNISRLGRCTSITTLELIGVELPSLADLLRLLRSFSNLSVLILRHPHFARGTSTSTIAQLQAQRACWSPPRLRRLEAHNVGGAGVGGGLLQLLGGGGIEELCIADNCYRYPRAYSANCLAGYTGLKALDFELTWAALPKPDSPPQPERLSWLARELLLDVVGPVRSPALRAFRLTFYVDSHNVATKAGPAGGAQGQERSAADEQPEVVCRYLNTRTGLLDEIFGRELNETLVGLPAFHSLSALILCVRENSDAYGEAWWRRQIERRLPGVQPGLIHVDFASALTEEYICDQLWESEPEPGILPSANQDPRLG